MKVKEGFALSYVTSGHTFFSGPLLTTLLTILNIPIPRKALSITKKAQISHKEHNCVMAQAVAEYQAEQTKTGKKHGLQKICMDIHQAYLQETGNVIHINHCTLNNLAKGGQSMSDFNADKRWLSCGKEDILVSYILNNA
jgi:hypothetical protein